MAPEKSKSENCSLFSDSLRPHGLQPTGLLCPWNFPGKNAEMGCRFLLQGIFLTQGSNPGLLHYREILYVWATREHIPKIGNDISVCSQGRFPLCHSHQHENMLKQLIFLMPWSYIFSVLLISQLPMTANSLKQSFSHNYRLMAAVYGVAQSQTRLKRLSSSSSRTPY